MLIANKKNDGTYIVVCPQCGEGEGINSESQQRKYSCCKCGKMFYIDKK